MGNSKLKKAVAIKYESMQDHAPKVTAKGAGFVAERIIELASKQGIPMAQDPDLVTALMKLDFHEEIPEVLYQVVAEVLAFAYRLNGKMAENL
jgi:flagellar biosynthesis protein